MNPYEILMFCNNELAKIRAVNNQIANGVTKAKELPLDIRQKLDQPNIDMLTKAADKALNDCYKAVTAYAK